MHPFEPSCADVAAPNNSVALNMDVTSLHTTNESTLLPGSASPLTCNLRNSRNVIYDNIVTSSNPQNFTRVFYGIGGTHLFTANAATANPWLQVQIFIQSLVLCTVLLCAGTERRNNDTNVCSFPIRILFVTPIFSLIFHATLSCALVQAFKSLYCTHVSSFRSGT